MNWDWKTIIPIGALIVALVGAYGVGARWTGTVDARLSSVEGSIESLSSKIDGLTNTIINPAYHGKLFDSSQEYSDESSPLVKKIPVTLSPKGVEMAKRLGAEDTVKLLVDKIDVPQNASLFAIQQASEIFAFTRMMEIVSSDVKLKIEDEADTDGGDIGDVLGVYSILLRDEILGSHGLPVPKYNI